MMIIKIGGGRDIQWDYIARDIKTYLKREPVVVVHGANYIRDNLASSLGKPTRTIVSPSGISSVYTDSEAIDIFLSAYAGIANKRLVALFQKCGIPAVGLSGVDGGLFQAERKKNVYSVESGKTKLITDNLTGKVYKINTTLIKVLLNNNFVPVVCPPAISKEHDIVNIDGDMATAQLAAALKADKILFLFESIGLLKKFPDEKTRIKKISKDKLGEYINYAQGRMKKKILAATSALSSGVSTVYFGDGRIKKPVTHCLKGTGTIIQ